jgi:hypothetical protein
VEDLIRTSLGSYFIDNVPQKKEEFTVTKEEIPLPQEIEETQDEEDEIIRSSIQRLKNFDPSHKKDSGKKEVSNSFKEKERDPNLYYFYNNLPEVFECRVTIEGKPKTSSVRLILNTGSWNLLFEGKIESNGMCSIPIKSLSLFSNGTMGKATLEVIVDDIIFTPWESEFVIERSNKIGVEVTKR